MTTTMADTSPVRSDLRINTSYLTHTLLIGLRNPAFLMFTVALPLTYYLLFSSMYSSSSVNAVSFNDVYTVNMATFGSINAALAGGTRIEAELTSGWLRQVRLTPLSSLGFLLTRTITALLFELPPILVLYVVGASRSTSGTPIWSWVGSGATVWLGSIPFILIGLLIGLFLKNEAAMPASVAVMTLMALVGGLWIPLQVFPGWVRDASHLVPSAWMARYGQDILSGAASSAGGVLVYVVWISAVGGLVAFLLGRSLSSRR